MSSPPLAFDAATASAASGPGARRKAARTVCVSGPAFRPPFPARFLSRRDAAEFGQAIVALRGMRSQAEVARRAGMGRVAWSR